MGTKKRKPRAPKQKPASPAVANVVQGSSPPTAPSSSSLFFGTAIFQLLIAGIMIFMMPRFSSNAPSASSDAFDFQARQMQPDSFTTSTNAKALASKYFNAAATFDGSRGEGHKGWLYLLAAHGYATNPEILDNLVNNYLAADYWYLALDEVREVQENANLPELHDFANDLERVILRSIHGQDKENKGKIEAYEKFTQRPEKNSMAAGLKRPEVLLPFSTAVSSFKLSKQFPELTRLNGEFYQAALESYNMMRAEKGSQGLSETELNHKYFRWQMDILRKTGDYWTGFTKLELFKDLMETMREAAVKVLQLHGLSEKKARRKAHHDIIFWVSVHTGNSVHEPHMTEDSLLGGVYYVSVPPFSGRLELFDPRSGVQTVCPNTVKELVNPPFHRTVEIQPEEGLLVIFPGWLVHGVQASKGLDVAQHKYRVSISVNLKGEWQDTTQLRFLLR